MAAPITERLSVSSEGVEGNGPSTSVVVSADGRFVAFVSVATNLVPGDTNGVDDVYVRDRMTNTTQRVNVSSSGSEANAASRVPLAISADGRYVAFSSVASNLVPADANGVEDVFVRDMETDTTRRVSVRSNEDEARRFSRSPSISADGRYVTFQSFARLGRRDNDRGADVYVRDRLRGVTREASVSSAGVDGNGPSGLPQISADGQIVAFPSSASNLADHTPELRPNVFLRNFATRRTTRLHVHAGRTLAAISDDGRYVSFYAIREGPNGVQLHVRDRRSRTTERVSYGFTYAVSQGDSLSAHGRYAAFLGTNVWTHVYVFDRREKQTIQVDVDSTGGETTPEAIGAPTISADGRFVAYSSDTANLVLVDTNGVEDAFLRGPLH